MPKEFIKKIDLVLSDLKDEQIAISQEAYMRNKFKFLGIKKPILKKEIKKIIKDIKIKNSLILIEIIDILWAKKEREYQYASMDIIFAHKSLWDPNFLDFFKKLIETNSWWDTVDEIAAKLIGNLIKKYRFLEEKIDSWICAQNFWIRRSALIYQLSFRSETNHEKLFSYCLMLAHEKEFFIRKAIGWALRQYSKTNNKAVKDFLIKNKDKLSYLSYSQASKYIK